MPKKTSPKILPKLPFKKRLLTSGRQASASISSFFKSFRTKKPKKKKASQNPPMSRVSLWGTKIIKGLRCVRHDFMGLDQASSRVPAWFQKVWNLTTLSFWIAVDTIRYRVYPSCLRVVQQIGSFIQKKYEAIQDKPEYEWAQPVSGSFARTVRLSTRTTFYTIVSLITFFVIWGSFFHIDEYVHAQGEVDPESDIKVVNHLEGGIIQEILVREGDRVQKNQILMRLDDTTANAAYREALKNYYNSWAHILRLEAQINKKPLEFPDEIVKFSPQIVREAQEAYEAHGTLVQKEQRILIGQLDQTKIAVDEMKKKIENLSHILAITTERSQRFDMLAKDGLVSRNQSDQAKIEAESRKADLDSSKINLTKLQSAVDEAQQKLASVASRYENQDWQALEEQQRRFNETQKIIAVSQDKLKRNEIRSPIDGVVQQVVFKTLGASVPSGRDVFSIIPAQDSLRINAFVLPQDIGFVKVGEKVSVKVTAFDYSIYGSLDGVVESISADTFKMSAPQQQAQAQPQQSYYRVYVRTSKDYIDSKGQKFQITPGMTTMVDIISGRRSVLYYLLKPIVKSTSSALHEK